MVVLHTSWNHKKYTWFYSVCAHTPYIIHIKIHQMFSPICFPNFVHESLSVWTVEKGKKNLIGQKKGLSLPVEKEIITNFVDSEFKIGDQSDDPNNGVSNL